MNQIKIGKFIAECRKKNNLTQMQLAEKLNITDRAISKWENGITGESNQQASGDIPKEQLPAILLLWQHLQVNYLMNTGNTLRALQEAELTKEQAFADDYPYGISTCLRMMGNIYFARRENRTALDYYQQSLVYTQRSSLSRIYLIYTGTYPCSNKT